MSWRNLIISFKQIVNFYSDHCSHSITDQQIGTLLYRDIQYAFFDFLDKILKDCDLNPAVGRIPLKWEQPVYGDQVPNFTDFAAPGVILSNENENLADASNTKKSEFLLQQ